MRHFLAATLVFGLICASPAGAEVVTLTFDELDPCDYHGPYGGPEDVPPCGVITNQYPGVAFSSDAPNFFNEANPGLFDDRRAAAFLFPEVAHSGGNIIAPWDGEYFVFNASLFVDFETPVNNLSFWTGGDETLATLAVIDIFGEGGALLDTIDLLSNAAVLAFHDLSAFANVTRIAIRDIVAGANGAALYYDTFSFEVAEAPAPAGALLLLTGVLGLRAARRKKLR